MKKCLFDGCDKEVRSAGFCNGHYRQHHFGEELRPLQVQYHGLSEYERFLKRVQTDDPDKCWNWLGSSNKKGWHGQWRNQSGGIELAHRAAWRLMKGSIPQGMCVLHHCDNPVCVNPTHLFLGSQSDNCKDMWAKGRARPKTNYGEKHGMSKLNSEKVLEIRSSNLSNKELGEKFSVSSTTICDVRKRRIWKHL